MPTSDIEKAVLQPLLSSDTERIEPESPKPPRVKAVRIQLGVIITLLCFACSFVTYQTFFETREIPSGWLERCAWRDLEPHVHLLDVAPITRDEFLQRQSILAAALDKAGVDAFIAEPSASTSYYANISTSFDLSERPFLMIIDKNAQFSYLAPKF